MSDSTKKINDVLTKVLLNCKLLIANKTLSVGGIMVSIAAFQAVDPSSILGHRKIFYF